MISEKRWKSLKSYGSAQQLSNQVSSKCNGHLSLMREPTATIKMGMLPFTPVRPPREVVMM